MKKKKPAETPGPLCLSHGDHLAMVIADKDAAVAAAVADRDLARLQAFKAQTAAQIAKGEEELTSARTAAAAAALARSTLATQVAERYAVNWQDTVIEPMTGQLLPIEKD